MCWRIKKDKTLYELVVTKTVCVHSQNGLRGLFMRRQHRSLRDRTTKIST